MPSSISGPAHELGRIIINAVEEAISGEDVAAYTYKALDPPGADSGECQGVDDLVPIEPPTWPDYAWHAPLLAADLLPFAPATLSSYLDSTFAEYAREAREELP